MSEQEKKSGSAGGSPLVVVEKSANSRHKPYRPTDMQDDTEIHHKRCKAPAVPSAVAEELKNLTQGGAADEKIDTKDRKENAISSDKLKQNVSKTLSSNTKKRGSSPESIALTVLDIETRKSSGTPPSQPIPEDIKMGTQADINAAGKEAIRNADTDSITDEIADLRPAEPTKEHSDWSDDEEAGGLPRSESRASRVSRVVRQFFCCGVPYEAPSEENIAGRAFGQGI